MKKPSGAAAAVLFAQWVWRRLPRAGAITAIAVLLQYPYAFFLYGAMYSDSLFIFTALAAFMLLERRHYWLAGLVGSAVGVRALSRSDSAASITTTSASGENTPPKPSRKSSGAPRPQEASNSSPVDQATPT